MKRALVIILLLAAGVGARADLVVQSGSREAEAGARMIHRHVPRCYTQVAIECPFEVVSPVSMFLLSLDPRVVGIYRDVPWIWVESGLTPADRMHTSIHEYGHFVWYQLMTDGERATYTALWARLKAAHRLPSDYAETSDVEGFAESFAEVYSAPTWGDPAEREFMHAIERRLSRVPKSGNRRPAKLVILPPLSYRPLLRT